MNFWSVIYDLGKGFSLTLELFALTLVFAIPLGLVFAFCSMSKFKPVSYLMKGIIWVVRGTPLLLQCILVTFIPSTLFKIPNKDLVSMLNLDKVADLQFLFVLIAFAINYACYFSVIFEGGIKSIPEGQYEAGKVLGLSKKQTFWNIILMQVVKRVTAPMSNEIITLVKDTALARALGVAEIVLVAYEKVNKYVVLTPLIYAAIFYLVFSGLLTILFHYIDKKLGYFKA